MTGSIYLNRSKTSQWEPSEGDDKNGSWISPFEVPRSIHLTSDPRFNCIRVVEFRYSGGETGNRREVLDDSDRPSVLIRSGRHSGKILELAFAYPISLDGLPSIGERLKKKSRTCSQMATRFNYQMVASIFQNWNEAVDPVDEDEFGHTSG
jgi:hypothetical protein